jgi:polysaccharide biosynthesis acetyltransferase WcbI-like protein
MRNLVVIGNCQAEMVTAGLRHPAFEGRLEATYHFVELPECRRQVGRLELAECDTVLVQDIGNFDDYPLRAAIPERAEIVTFPCLRLASPWPFDSQNGPGDAHARACEAQPPVFSHFDGLLGRLRGEIADGEERFQAYRSLALDGLVNFRRMHQFEERRLRGLDSRFDSTIGQFMLDNFRTSRLLCATGQPKPALYRLLLQWLLSRLGIAGDYPDDGFLDAADGDEVPVHPAVAQALGVSWADEGATYRFHGAPIRWEGYVRRYIEHFG